MLNLPLQILMLSGIGPASELKVHGIPIVAELPGVGAHLMDHPGVHVRFRAAPGESLNYLSGDTLWKWLRTQRDLVQWLATGKGPMTTNVRAAFMSFHRSRSLIDGL